jgi:hypothetical protein
VHDTYVGKRLIWRSIARVLVESGGHRYWYTRALVDRMQVSRHKVIVSAHAVTLFTFDSSHSCGEYALQSPHVSAAMSKHKESVDE